MFLLQQSQPENPTSSSGAPASASSGPPPTTEKTITFEPVIQAIARIKNDTSKPDTRHERLLAINNACSGLNQHLKKNHGKIAPNPNFASLELDEDVRECLNNVYTQDLEGMGDEYLFGLRRQLKKFAYAGMD